MYNVEYLVRDEQNKDMQREANNERLARQVQAQSRMLNNARNVLGRGLVQAGQRLLNER